jgi:hypothetical protein
MIETTLSEIGMFQTLGALAGLIVAQQRPEIAEAVDVVAAQTEILGGRPKV